MQYVYAFVLNLLFQYIYYISILLYLYYYSIYFNIYYFNKKYRITLSNIFFKNYCLYTSP